MNLFTSEELSVFKKSNHAFRRWMIRRAISERFNNFVKAEMKLISSTKELEEWFIEHSVLLFKHLHRFVIGYAAHDFPLKIEITEINIKTTFSDRCINKNQEYTRYVRDINFNDTGWFVDFNIKTNFECRTT